jgi:hypothetical protein
MDEHTHPAAATVTLFAPQASAIGTVTAEQQRVEYTSSLILSHPYNIRRFPHWPDRRRQR